MKQSLRFSHSELSNLLKYSFQGLFGHSCDWGALTDYVLWLETRGFKGLSLLYEAIQDDVLIPFSGRFTEKPWGYEIDMNGGSVLTALPAISDLAMDYTLSKGACRIEIVWGQQYQVLASVQADLMRAGLYAQTALDYSQMFSRSDVVSTRYRDTFQEAELVYRESLRDGVIVDPMLYSILNELAERTLVEATEASRRGAGD